MVDTCRFDLESCCHPQIPVTSARCGRCQGDAHVVLMPVVSEPPAQVARVAVLTVLVTALVNVSRGLAPRCTVVAKGSHSTRRFCESLR